LIAQYQTFGDVATLATMIDPTRERSLTLIRYRKTARYRSEDELPSDFKRVGFSNELSESMYERFLERFTSELLELDAAERWSQQSPVSFKTFLFLKA
jgi:hypothetical protein